MFKPVSILTSLNWETNSFRTSHLRSRSVAGILYKLRYSAIWVQSRSWSGFPAPDVDVAPDTFLVCKFYAAPPIGAQTTPIDPASLVGWKN